MNFDCPLLNISFRHRTAGAKKVFAPNGGLVSDCSQMQTGVMTYFTSNFLCVFSDK